MFVKQFVASMRTRQAMRYFPRHFASSIANIPSILRMTAPDPLSIAAGTRLRISRTVQEVFHAFFVANIRVAACAAVGVSGDSVGGFFRRPGCIRRLVGRMAGRWVE